MSRFFNYWVDTYFLFRNKQLTNLSEEIIKLHEGYDIKLIETFEDDYIDSLISFWKQSYSKNDVLATNEVRSLLLRGDACIGVVCQNRVVGMTWCGGHVAIERIPFANILKKEKNIGIGHHDFVDAGHRGKGLQRALSVVRLRYAHQKGCSAFYVFVGVKNIASVINLMKVFSEYKIVFHVKVDVPLISINLFPGFQREDWSQC